jgi:hypothetical protein
MNLGPPLGSHTRIVQPVGVDVSVDGLEIGLVDHAELVLRALLVVRVGGVDGCGCDDDVESALQHGGEGDAFDCGEGEEGDGLFEAED